MYSANTFVLFLVISFSISTNIQRTYKKMIRILVDFLKWWKTRKEGERRRVKEKDDGIHLCCIECDHLSQVCICVDIDVVDCNDLRPIK